MSIKYALKLNETEKKKSKFWNCAFVGALSVEFISEAVVRDREHPSIFHRNSLAQLL
jgi:hypothetical protein